MRRKYLYIVLIIAIILIIGFIVYYTFYYSQSQEKRERFFFKGTSIGEVLRDRPNTIVLYSPAFKNNTRIPDKYTCTGEDVSPPIVILDLPANTKSLVILMVDPDAPSGIFYHWLLYNIPPKTSKLPENIPKTKITKYGYQGINSFGKIGYNGPCPPIGHGTHHYYIIVLALDTKLDLSPGIDAATLLNSVKGHVIAYGYIIGTYSR